MSNANYDENLSQILESKKDFRKRMEIVSVLLGEAHRSDIEEAVSFAKKLFELDRERYQFTLRHLNHYKNLIDAGGCLEEKTYGTIVDYLSKVIELEKNSLLETNNLYKKYKELRTLTQGSKSLDEGLEE